MSGIEPSVRPDHPAATGATLACARCEKPVDPLRAARVAIFHERFRYFCSADCRAAYDPDAGRTPLPLPKRTPPASEATDDLEAAAAPRPLEGPPDEPSAELLEPDPAARGDQPATPELADAPTQPSEIVALPEVGGLLLGLASLGGVLAVALALAGDSTTAIHARALVVVVAAGALVAQYLMGRRDAIDPHPAAFLAAPIAAALGAGVAAVTGAAQAAGFATLGGLVVATSAIGLLLVQRAVRPLEVERDHIQSELDGPARRVVGDEVVTVRAHDLRPGEEILVEAGERFPADCAVTAGEAVLLPWLGASSSIEPREGDAVVAGAKVARGRLRAVVGWASFDRTWLRMINDPKRRADVFAPMARFGRLAAERWAPVAAGLAALTAYAGNQEPLGIAMFAVAAQAAVANLGLSQIGALHVASAVLAGLRRGIAFRSSDAFDRTGRVTSAAFCARGTLLLGEPELANLEPVGAFDAKKLLALLAGAESGASHAVAKAIQRAARARGVRPDAVRSPSPQQGLGLTAVASDGQQLVVGSRALMLKERIGVASAETTISDLEAMGRSVLLVALGGRLVGVAGLQDGLRPGARAAVQHLLDVGVEPVLLSGDTRETCETLARTLDIEHIRPEVLPADRGDEVRRLADAGSVVAVLGRSPADDSALAAADVSVALGMAGSTVADWNVQLASDDVRDAAYAIRLAHECRTEARLGLSVTLATGAGGALGVAFGMLPPALAPLLALAGTLVALARLRSFGIERQTLGDP